MDNEVYTFALKNTIDEIKNICPHINNSFMFKQDGEIIAGDENTDEKTIGHAVDAFDSVLEKADAVGGVEGLVIEGSKGRLTVSSMNDVYLVTVASKSADMTYVNTVTRVLVPTVLKLLDKIDPASLKNKPSKHIIAPGDPFVENDEEEMAKTVKEPLEEKSEQLETESEPLELEAFPSIPVSQFIIENLGGLLVPSDTVRIDSQTISQWEENCENKKIEEVEIETFGGKKTKCKVKPIKDSKYEGKGIVQMPEKIQLTLEIKKGELVRIKPVIE